MYAAKERETLVIETAHILSFGLFLCPQCSATRFLRNSDKINKKNEPTISLAGLVLFCCYEVAVALKVKPPLDPLRFTVFAKDSPLELVAVTVR